MIIEFQFEPEPFLVAFRNRIKRTPVCVKEVIPLTDGECAGNTVLDHVKVWDGTLLQRVNGGLQILQPIGLNFVSLASLEANGELPSDPCWVPTIVLSFEFTIEVDENTPSVTIKYLGLDPSSTVSDDQKEFINAILIAKLSPQTTPLDLSKLEKAVGPVSVLKAGVGGDTNLTRLAVRLEVQSLAADSETSWSSFFSGNLFANPNHKQWSLFIDRDLITASIVRQFEHVIEIQASENKFSLDSGPEVLYLGGAAPVFMTVFSGEAIDACVCGWDEIDLDVDLTANIVFSVLEENKLRLDMSVFWTLNAFESACCASSAFAFWWLIGTDLLQQGEINWGQFLAGLGLLPSVFTGALLIAHEKAGEHIEVPPKWAEISKKDDDPKLYRMEFDFSGFGAFELTLDDVTGTFTGLVLGGTTSAPVELKDPELDLNVQGAPFAWGFEDPCGDDPLLTATSFITPGDKDPNPSLAAPITVCDVRIISPDPQHQFDTYLTWDSSEISIKVPLGGIEPAYAGNEPPDGKYPCKLLIITTGGCRIFSVPPLPILNAADVQQKLHEHEFWSIFHCSDEWAFGDDFWKGSRYNPRWTPDPPPDAVTAHLWEFALAGLAAGESVALDGADGPIGTALAYGSGSAHISAMLAPRGEGEISLLRSAVRQGAASEARSLEGESRRPPRQAGHEIGIHQVLLVEQARVRLDETVVGTALGTFAGSQALAIATSKEIRTYDLASLSLPRWIHQRRTNGVRGVLAWKDGFLAWGRAGVSVIGRGARSACKHACGDVPILDARQYGTNLFLLTHGRLLKLNSDLIVTAETDVTDARHMAISGGILAIASQTAVDFCELQGFPELRPRGSYSVQRASGLWASRIAGIAASFFVRAEEGGGPVVFTKRGRNAQEMCRFVHDPWFARSTQTRRLMATVQADRKTVALYSVYRTVSLRR